MPTAVAMTAKDGRMLLNQDSHLLALLQIYIHRGNQSFIGRYTGGFVPPWKAKSANMKEKRQRMTTRIRRRCAALKYWAVNVPKFIAIAEALDTNPVDLFRRLLCERGAR